MRFTFTGGFTSGATINGVSVMPSIASDGRTAMLSYTFAETAPVSHDYVITGSGTSFTAIRGGIIILAANQPIQAVIDAVRADANSEDVVIHFGSGGVRLDIGTASVSFNNTGDTWGTITLQGGITSANTDLEQGTITVSAGITVNNTGEIINTGAQIGSHNPLAINNRGLVNIRGGMVSATNTGIAIFNRGNGSVNVSGGTVSAPNGWAIYSRENISANIHVSGGVVSGFGAIMSSDGTITVRGGSVIATSGHAIRSYTGQITVTGTARIEKTSGGGAIIMTGFDGTPSSGSTARLEISGGQLSVPLFTNNSIIGILHRSTGSLNFSGGSITTVWGSAIVSENIGLITISGTATISSESRNTILINAHDTSTASRLIITGGTISNWGNYITNNNNTITNHSTGSVTITGGTVTKDRQDMLGFAVESTNTNASLILGGAPNITGALRIAPGRLRVENSSFGSRIFQLNPESLVSGQIAVVNGAGVSANFALQNLPAWRLAAEGGNLVIRP
jgi:hypothetical protein